MSGFEDGQFKWPEYAVFSSVLACSVGIGIFFGCFGSKNATNEEYLLGNKKMNPIPVALSLLCSYVSSITLLGHPVEIYFYGTQLMMVLLTYIPLTWSLMYLYVPFYFNLQITSVYEYIELRFNHIIRSFLSLVNFFYCIFYMALVIYGPAIALSHVTGMNHRVLVAILFTVCIFYSSIGGIKAVLWTDSLQAVIMLVSMAVVVIMGISNIDGGLSTIWKRAESTNRINFFNFDADPRTRHTFWTAIIGGYFQWLPMYANQAQVQRYISLPSLKSVKIALLINIVGLWIIMGLCYLAGLVIYGNYFTCDPWSNREIGSPDQLLPKFVMDVLQNTPGLPGLFVAGITCAGLSTVSSVVNSLAANIVEDGVKKWRSNLTDTQLALISKLISVVTGVIGFGFVFVAESMGSIFSAATTMLGILGGPTLGIFVTGMFFPWANTWGATFGMFCTFGFMGFLGFGSRNYANRGLLPVQALPLDTSGCNRNESVTTVSPNLFEFSSTVSPSNPIHWKDREYSGLATFFSLSDLWYPAVGCILTVFLGLLFSFLFNLITKKKWPRLPSRLFVPLVLKMWIKLFPKYIETLVILNEEEHKEILDNSDLSVSNVSINNCKADPYLEKPKEYDIYISTDNVPPKSGKYPSLYSYKSKLKY